MLITKVEVQKKHKDRVNLYLDGEFYCGLTLVCAIKYHLKDGVEIDKERLDFLRQETEHESACEKGIKYVSRSQKTEKEMKTYLFSKGFDDETVDYAVQKLKKYAFLDDEQYVQNFIKYKSQGSGKIKIEYELKQKGIDDKLISKALSNYEFDDEVLVGLATKYLKNKEKDAKTKQKAYRYLASRGFESEKILRTLNKFFNSD